MNTTAILLACALLLTGAAAVTPTAAADTIVDCVLWEGHPPTHCVADCIPPNTPLSCQHDDDE